MQHRPIPDAVSNRGIGSIQDRLHLVSGEVAYKTSIRFLRRNSQNALHLLQRRRNSVLHEVHERLDGRKSDVPGTSTVSSGRFQVAQKVHDKGSINLLQMQFGRPNLQTLAGVLEQKFERVRVGIASVRARSPLNRQALLQKGRDMRGDQSHSSVATTLSSLRATTCGW